MKYKEITGLNEADRKKKLVEAQKELIKLNAQVVTGTPPKSPGRINQLKKDIARILTFESKLSNSKKTINSNTNSQSAVSEGEK